MKLSCEYLAGYFDGEGSIGIYRYKAKGVNRQIAIATTYRPILEILHEKYGGTLYQSSPGLNKPIHRWSVNSKAAIARFLEDLLPYLIEKREQAEWALREARGEVGSDEAIIVLKKLKGKADTKGENHAATYEGIQRRTTATL